MLPLRLAKYQRGSASAGAMASELWIAAAMRQSDAEIETIAARLLCGSEIPVAPSFRNGLAKRHSRRPCLGTAWVCHVLATEPHVRHLVSS